MALRLGSASLLDILPGNLSADATIRAAVTALDAVLSASVKRIPTLLIFSRLARAGSNEMLAPLGRLAGLSGGLEDLPEEVLDSLVWQYHVGGYEGGILAENATNKRTLILEALNLHRLKGTPASLKRAIASAGLGDAEILERPGELIFDGQGKYGGLHTYGPDANEWAEYHLVMGRPVTHDQAVLIRELCAECAPVRCHLKSIVYTEAALRYNAQGQYDGTYNHGAI